MQTGYIYPNGKYWTLRYYETVLENGALVRYQRTRKLAPLAEYPNKTSVRPLADAFLGPINSHVARPESSQRVSDFLEHTYMPHVEQTKRPSTYKNYLVQFGMLKPHLNGITMHEFRTPEADALLRQATSDKMRAHTSHKNLKSFLSGAFKFAKRHGAIDRENPVRDTEIPKGKRTRNTPAYTFEEIVAMLEVLEEPGRTLVLVAALTGLRISEVLGLRWEDFNDTGDELTVNRSVWMGHVSETKTAASAATIPVIDFVSDALAQHKARTHGTGFVFANSKGLPMWEGNIVRRDIRPVLNQAKIVWRGWHACRRGLATNLYELGVRPVTVQAILRHANVSTTLRHYIKPVDAATTAAMDKLAKAFGKSEAKRKRA
jgi:integrase